jgi:hypothetical protein
MARARVQLKVTKLLSEFNSELEIPCEQNEDADEAALPPSESDWESWILRKNQILSITMRMYFGV